MVDLPISISWSNRPGRRNAESKESSRFVAAITNTKGELEDSTPFAWKGLFFDDETGMPWSISVIKEAMACR